MTYIPVIRLPKDRETTTRLFGEPDPEHMEIYNAIYDALAGMEMAADSFLQVLASFVAATIAVHPSTRNLLEAVFSECMHEHLQRLDHGNGAH